MLILEPSLMTTVTVEMQRETKGEGTKESIFISNRIFSTYTNSKTIGLKTVNIQKVFTEYIIFLKTNTALFLCEPQTYQPAKISAFLFSTFPCTPLLEFPFCFNRSLRPSRWTPNTPCSLYP